MNGGGGVGERAHPDTQALGGPETSPGNGGLDILSMSLGPGCVEKYLGRLEPHMVWASPGPVCTFTLGVPTTAGQCPGGTILQEHLPSQSLALPGGW